MSKSKRNAASARAFLEYPEFNYIVDICRLKPTNSWKTWEDEEKNKLIINKHKKVFIRKATNIQHSTSDIFKKSLPKHIEKNSKWVMVLLGKSKKILAFIGNDERLRACYFEHNKWEKNISPLLLGFDCLKNIEKYKFIQTDKNLEIKCSLFRVRNNRCYILPNEEIINICQDY